MINRISSAQKICSLTLKMLEGVFLDTEHVYESHEGSQSWNCMFVARLLSKENGLLFSDETGYFLYSSKKKINFRALVVGKYYRCTLHVRFFQSYYKTEIINIESVEGNCITQHMAKVITGEFQYQIQKDSNQSGREQQKKSSIFETRSLYDKMCKWAQRKNTFTQEQLRNQFINIEKQQFDQALERMEDAQVVSNMGSFYEWLG